MILFENVLYAYRILLTLCGSIQSTKSSNLQCAYSTIDMILNGFDYSNDRIDCNYTCLVPSFFSVHHINHARLLPLHQTLMAHHHAS